jgi:uncharacterized membrane protein YeaQ/YmgE (transglycosylase-associated protein family)
MTLLAWIAIGLIAGFAARTLVLGKLPVSLADCLLLGSLGAIIGGTMFGLLGSSIGFEIAGTAAGAIAMLGVCAYVRQHGTFVVPDRNT